MYTVPDDVSRVLRELTFLSVNRDVHFSLGENEPGGRMQFSCFRTKSSARHFSALLVHSQSCRIKSTDEFELS